MKYQAFIVFIMTLSIATWSDADQLEVQISIPEFSAEKYERPYVAVWIADIKNKPATVLALWAEDERWLKELKYFWRRVLRNNKQIVDGVSGATKGPGEYRFAWDGKNADGDQLAEADYKLCAEVAREHGGHKAKCVRFAYVPIGMGNGMDKAEINLQAEFTRLSIRSLPAEAQNEK